jgi:hypothetical protein
MTSEEVNNQLRKLNFICDEIRTGLRNNLLAEEWHTSKTVHESILNKVEAIKLILKV